MGLMPVCEAVPGKRMKATVELIEEPILELNAPDVKVENYQSNLNVR